MRFILISWFAILAHAGPDPYDLTKRYANPLRPLVRDCVDPEIEFLRVTRPLFPLVEHVFVGVRWKTHCPDGERHGQAVYGASKGLGDDRFLAQHPQLAGEFRRGEAAIAALDRAAQISRGWQARLNQPAYLAARLIATPILGRPCALAADEVLRAIGTLPADGSSI